VRRSLSSSRIDEKCYNNSMNAVEAITTLNLTETADGTIRIDRTRVSLDSVYHHFTRGATAEEIVQKFPSLKLSDAYGAIAFILQNRKYVETYIRRQRKEAKAIEASIQKRFARQNAEIRKRILARGNNKERLA